MPMDIGNFLTDIEEMDEMFGVDFILPRNWNRHQVIEDGVIDKFVNARKKRELERTSQAPVPSSGVSLAVVAKHLREQEETLVADISSLRRSGTCPCVLTCLFDANA